MLYKYFNSFVYASLLASEFITICFGFTCFADISSLQRMQGGIAPSSVNKMLVVFGWNFLSRIFIIRTGKQSLFPFLVHVQYHTGVHLKVTIVLQIIYISLIFWILKCIRKCATEYILFHCVKKFKHNGSSPGLKIKDKNKKLKF